MKGDFRLRIKSEKKSGWGNATIHDCQLQTDSLTTNKVNRHWWVRTNPSYDISDQLGGGRTACLYFAFVSGSQ